jgi:SAM-dependent methyltransferase
MSYLETQARIGMSLHHGGLHATRELLALCHVSAAKRVLDVGCGVGVAPCLVARRHGCLVVGVDSSPKMLEWARARVHKEGVAEKVELREADALGLPFESGAFDLVMSESVLAFVPDKARAIAEMVRVLRPGGWLGINDGVWLRPPPPRDEQAMRELGGHVVDKDAWRALWDGSGLCERVIRHYAIYPWREALLRVQWLGLAPLVAAWGRAFSATVRDRQFVRTVRRQQDSSLELSKRMGYGLFVGRKPAR